MRVPVLHGAAGPLHEDKTPSRLIRAWAELREAQLQSDADRSEDGHGRHHRRRRREGHPSEEEGTGRRSARVATPRIAYGQKIVAKGRLIKAMKVKGNKAVVSFDNFGSGLERRGDKLTGFRIAGEEQKF